MTKDEALGRINALFGSYRAEWLDNKVFELFSEPRYFPELMTNRPCVMLGGRGTGKTTVLRCLSYEGQFALKQGNSVAFAENKFFGIFYRVDTNRVTAFKGSERTEDQWTKLFGHYMNLVLGSLFVRFLCWHHRIYPDLPVLSTTSLKLICTSFHIPIASDLNALATKLRERVIEYEAEINNIAEAAPQHLTIQGAPLDVLTDSARDLIHFQDCQFSFLIDEYENFTDYQQRAFNTLIKHVGNRYTIKIGVKQLGWRVRQTLNGTEQLVSPADYNRISLDDRLEGDVFDEFALHVCQTRLKQIDPALATPVDQLFPGIQDEKEADLLLAGNSPFTQEQLALISSLPIDAQSHLNALTILERIFLVTWPENKAADALLIAIGRYTDGERKIHDRYENYKHSLLFALRRGKIGIRKYYAGWDVYTKLASGNIRFFLELVERSLIAHLHEEKPWGNPLSLTTQTNTAIGVGRKNLDELEGLDVDGAKLTKLVLGLGRVFQIMAADPIAHAPEVNQFQISGADSTSETERAENLIRSAVNHVALVRMVGSKLGDPGETKDADYAVHPIFSAFFAFSYRRKRKMTLTPGQIISLVDRPKAAIHEILKKSARSESDDSLPEQMMLFEAYYDSRG